MWHHADRLLVGTALTVLILDLASKLIVVATLEGITIRLLGGFLTLLVTRNSGAAFSIGTSMTLVFSAIAIGVIVVILRLRGGSGASPGPSPGLCSAGPPATDRRSSATPAVPGHVVDFLELPHWRVFNLAHSAIVCAGVLAVLLSARGVRAARQPGGHRHPPDGQEPPIRLTRPLPPPRRTRPHPAPG